jgi:hypothetical protein
MARGGGQRDSARRRAHESQGHTVRAGRYGSSHGTKGHREDLGLVDPGDRSEGCGEGA